MATDIFEIRPGHYEPGHHERVYLQMLWPEVITFSNFDWQNRILTGKTARLAGLAGFQIDFRVPQSDIIQDKQNQQDRQGLFCDESSDPTS